MTQKDKTTEDSKVDLTDEQLDAVDGGGVFIKFDDIRGESVEVAQGGAGKVKFDRLNIRKYSD